MARRYATKAEVLALATDLTDEPPLDELIEIAKQSISVETWGSKASDGHRALAAHLATVVMNPTAATGPIASRSIGSISVSYAVAAPATDSDLSSSKWGRLYLMLRAGVIVTPVVGRYS